MKFSWVWNPIDEVNDLFITYGLQGSMTRRHVTTLPAQDTVDATMHESEMRRAINEAYTIRRNSDIARYNEITEEHSGTL